MCVCTYVCIMLVHWLASIEVGIGIAVGMKVGGGELASVHSTGVLKWDNGDRSCSSAATGNVIGYTCE